MSRAKVAIKEGRFGEAQVLLQDWVKVHRENQEARFLLARVLAWQGKYQEALPHYDLLLRRYPDNADYMLGKAQTLVWSGRPDAALPLLQGARARVPGYEDVWRLEIRILTELGQQEKTQALIEQARKQFPDTRWDSSQKKEPAIPSGTQAEAVPGLPQMPTGSAGSPIVAELTKMPQTTGTVVTPFEAKPIEVELGVSRENLDKGYANWRSTYIGAEKKLGERHVVYASLRETERFSLTDTEWLGGISYPLGSRWMAIFEANVSASHHVLPKWSALGQIQYAFDDGWGAHLGLRHTEYSNAQVNMGIITLERYWKNYRATYTRYESFLLGQGSAASNRLQFAHYYEDRNWLGLSWSDGRELENMGANAVLDIPVKALVLGGRHWLNRDWGLSYEAGAYRQGDFYTRSGMRLGLRRQF